MSKIAEIIARSEISLTKLSKKSGLTVDRLQALKEEAEPSLAELRQLASSLSIPPTFLLAPARSQEQVNLLFRNNLSGPNRVDHSTIDFLQARMGYSLDLLESRQSSSRPLQRIEVDGETYENAERAAHLFREFFCSDDQYRPLLELPSIMTERLGVIVFVGNLRQFDGASATLEQQSFVFVSSRFAPRMLFTLAHELGHLTAHSSPNEPFAVLDQGTGATRITKSKSIREAFADTFASCLLLPSNGVGAALKAIRSFLKVSADAVGDVELLYLSRIFGVSFQVAARRCEDLDLLPGGGARALYQQLRSEYGSPERRAESLSLPPRPTVEFAAVPPRLLNAAVRRIRSGEMSIGRASAILGVSASELISANSPIAH